MITNTPSSVLAYAFILNKAVAVPSLGLGNTLLSQLQVLNGNKPVFFQQAKFWSQ
jgi:hypothetical protein